MTQNFSGRHAVVFGGSQGLGLASALKLAEGGANVTVISRSATQEHLVEQGLPSAQTQALSGDLTQGNMNELLSAAKGKFGPVDTLVLSGGGPKAGTFATLSDDDWTGAYHLLLLAPVRAIRAALPDMQAAGFGRIISVLSSGVKQPLPNLMLSNALRAATLGMLQTLSREVAVQGITVNGVVPGRIDTDRVRSLDQGAAERSQRTPEQVRTQSEASIPLGRYGRPAEFGAAVAFLATADASYITGSLIEVDGGLINTLT